MSMLSSPTLDSSMIFVDGSNLLIELGTVLKIHVRAERPEEDELSMATQCITHSLSDVFSTHIGAHKVMRKYWFGSIQGSQDDISSIQTFLRSAGYEGVIFSKRKGLPEKGVDLAVAREMLIHGFHRNYKTAILVAGDEDYLGLVQDLKRLGLLVAGLFFDGAAMSPKLKTALDVFAPIKHPIAVNSTLANSLKAINSP